MNFTTSENSAALALPTWLSNKNLAKDTETIAIDATYLTFNLAASSSIVCGTNLFFNSESLNGSITLQANAGDDAEAGKKIIKAQANDSVYELFCFADVSDTRSITTIKFTKGTGNTCDVEISSWEVPDENAATKHVDPTGSTYRLHDVSISDRS